MKQLGKMDKDERPVAGQKANEIRQSLTKTYDERAEKLKRESIAKQLESERVDVDLPAREVSQSYEHPVFRAQAEIISILKACGFVVEMGPEVENEWNNFDALNFPPNHPSRTMQDTFYVSREEKLVLRTHTSPVQVRTMLRSKPPVRMICPGRVYRADYDQTHSPMFHQVEGLLVDEDVHMGDLKGILQHLVSEFFGSELKVRLRPSFFPFTEPSAEVDMQCCFCKGSGCRTCKGTGWIEIGGCGMVDPEVFKSVEYDIDKIRGFAFGMGIERMAMLKYSINDLRSFYESDYRYFLQFPRWLL